MKSNAESVHETRGYLPSVFRTGMDTAALGGQQFVRWLLQVFEQNVHLSERMVENSGMLFDPEKVAGFARGVRTSRFSPNDLVNVPGFVTKLKKPQADEVSRFVYDTLPATVQTKVDAASGSDHHWKNLGSALIDELNKIVEGALIYTDQRFKDVKLAAHTRALLKLNPQQDALALVNRLLLQDAYPLEIAALPEAGLFHTADWEHRHLEWLASWVALELDQDWFVDESERPLVGTDTAARRYERVRQIIKSIAGLYMLRGTPAGLIRTTKLLYGLDVEVVRRSWPQGMQIEVSSSIGLDCCLMEELERDRHFVVIIKSNDQNRSLLPLSGEWFETRVAGQFSEIKIQSILKPEPATAGSNRSWSEKENIDARLPAMVTKIRSLIDDQKPAHTSYYLAVEAMPQLRVTQTQLLPFVVECNSVVGSFFMN